MFPSSITRMFAVYSKGSLVCGMLSRVSSVAGIPSSMSWTSGAMTFKVKGSSSSGWPVKMRSCISVYPAGDSFGSSGSSTTLLSVSWVKGWMIMGNSVVVIIQPSGM